jgi:hypothetical protein
VVALCERVCEASTPFAPLDTEAWSEVATLYTELQAPDFAARAGGVAPNVCLRLLQRLLRSLQPPLLSTPAAYASLLRQLSPPGPDAAQASSPLDCAAVLSTLELPPSHVAILQVRAVGVIPSCNSRRGCLWPEHDAGAGAAAAAGWPVTAQLLRCCCCCCCCCCTVGAMSGAREGLSCSIDLTPRCTSCVHVLLPPPYRSTCSSPVPPQRLCVRPAEGASTPRPRRGCPPEL